MKVAFQPVHAHSSLISQVKITHSITTGIEIGSPLKGRGITSELIHWFIPDPKQIRVQRIKFSPNQSRLHA